jgi:hypothetical protein
MVTSANRALLAVFGPTFPTTSSNRQVGAIVPKTEVELWQFLRMHSENVTKIFLKSRIWNNISRLHGF